MKTIQSFLLAAALLLAAQTGFSQKTPAVRTVGPEKGSLLIVGGGKVGPEIWSKFIELAGGESANIIIIPTAGDDSTINRGIFKEKELLESLGVQTVSVLHTRNPREADTEKFAAPIKKATGIWFIGGRQWKIADAILNTRTHRELNSLLNRGGVIAGTSAGATIQGSFLLRGDTKGNSILVGDHLEGLDFIHNVAIDQHILKRNRQFDLIEVIRSKPDLLGIGIDESTAILVRKDEFEVLGTSYAAVYESSKLNSPAPFVFLGRGQKYDLKNRQVIATGTKSATSISNK